MHTTCKLASHNIQVKSLFSYRSFGPAKRSLTDRPGFTQHPGRDPSYKRPRHQHFLANPPPSWRAPGLSRSDWGIYNFKAELAYKGTSFNGWQIQNGKSQAPTIQDELERALAAVKQERRAVGGLQGAGRTDSGVHARGQVVNFYTNKLTPEPHRLVLGLNAHLPDDIRVKSVARVPPDFNARYSALSKVYSYNVQLGPVADPFQQGLALHHHKPLDLDLIRKAAPLFLGEHDFTQFSSIPNLKIPLSPVKVITKVEVQDTPGGLRMVFDGSGFLYNQVRHMAGCLLAIGRGKPIDIRELLKTGKSDHPGMKFRGWGLAAAEGLYLEEVRYPPHHDPEVLLYPDVPHDEFGRTCLEGLSRQAQWAAVNRMKQYKIQSRRKIS